jgi:hypothetical protein
MKETISALLILLWFGSGLYYFFITREKDDNNKPKLKTKGKKTFAVFAASFTLYILVDSNFNFAESASKLLGTLWLGFGAYWIVTLTKKHLGKANYKPEITPMLSFTISIICLFLSLVTAFFAPLESSVKMFYPNISEQNEAIKNKENKFIDIAYEESKDGSKEYLVFTKSETFSEMEAYAKTKPWLKNTFTSVIFINNQQAIPDRNELEDSFGFSEICLKRKKSCIAIFSKFHTGNTVLDKYPFINFTR